MDIAKEIVSGFCGLREIIKEVIKDRQAAITGLTGILI